MSNPRIGLLARANVSRAYKYRVIHRGSMAGAAQKSNSSYTRRTVARAVRGRGLKMSVMAGYLQPMSAVRVPIAKFKENPRPFVELAKAGETVIVTAHGQDDFQVVPSVPGGAPPVSEEPLNPDLYRGIDVDEPAFESWK
jgi:hypothetical protein